MVIKTANTIFVVFYNPPSCNIETVFSNWSNILTSICSISCKPIFIGDINFNIFENRFLNFLKSHFLANYQNLPSRKNNILDICISTENNHINAKPVFDLPLSDHLPIVFNFLTNPLPSTKSNFSVNKFRNYKHFNFENYNNQLITVDWSSFDEAIINNDINTANDFLCDSIYTCFDLITPFISIKKKNNIFLPLELRCWMKKRNHLLKLTYLHPNNSIIKNDYKRIRNFVNSMRRNFNNHSIHNSFNKVEKNPKKLWKLINNFTGRNTISSCNLTPNVLNDFYSQFKPKSSAYLTPPNNYIRDNLFIFSDINRQTVFDSLKSMKMNSATGLDGVSY
ncbi:MAG: hypothetical protein ACRC0V_06160, partial [Fusobacteriaceae bacterium]